MQKQSSGDGLEKDGDGGDEANTDFPQGGTWIVGSFHDHTKLGSAWVRGMRRYGSGSDLPWRSHCPEHVAVDGCEHAHFEKEMMDEDEFGTLQSLTVKS